MNKIVVNLGNFKLDEITLTRGSLNIGRASDNDISLADSATSGHHAKIVTIFTSSFIQDLNSTNGTIVNGRKIVRHTLSHGDIISIGNLQLLFKSDASSSPEKADKGIHISKDEINSALSQSGKKIDAVKKSGPATEIIKKNDKLAGFSISIPSSGDLAEKPSSKAPPASPPSSPATSPTGPSIPVLDETLPLGELRRNPDRTVILTQHSHTRERTPESDSEENLLASKISTQSDEIPDESLLSIDSDLDDSQIRQILMQTENLDNHSRVYAKFAIAITVVLVIIAFTYILL